MNLRSKLENTGYEFLFSLIIAFVGLWYFMYNLIVNKALEDPIHFELIAYSIIHYMITLILLSLLIVTYMKGLISFDSERITNWLNKVCNSNNKLSKSMIDRLSKSKKVLGEFIYTLYEILFLTWMPLLLISVFVLFLASYSSNTSLMFFSFVIVIIFIVPFLFIYSSYQLKIFICLVIAVLGYFPSLLLITSLSSDVIVTTDKELYHKEEKVIATFTPKGYIFLPRVDSIKYGDSYATIKINHSGTYSLPKCGSTIGGINVFYKTQSPFTPPLTKWYKLNVINEDVTYSDPIVRQFEDNKD